MSHRSNRWYCAWLVCVGALATNARATVYELPGDGGVARVSMDGEIVKDVGSLPPLLRQRFAIYGARHIARDGGLEKS